VIDSLLRLSLLLRGRTPGGTAAAAEVAAHDHTGDELRRHWDDPRLRRQGNHPVIFAGGGSHAGAFEPGDVVVSVELPVETNVP